MQILAILTFVQKFIYFTLILSYCMSYHELDKRTMLQLYTVVSGTFKYIKLRRPENLSIVTEHKSEYFSYF
jgi:hypothetical protein